MNDSSALGRDEWKTRKQKENPNRLQKVYDDDNDVMIFYFKQ